TPDRLGRAGIDKIGLGALIGLSDNWHTDVTFIETPPAGAILAAKELPSTGGDTLWTSGIAAYEALSVPFRQLLSGLRAEHDFRKSFPEYKYRSPDAFAPPDVATADFSRPPRASV
ncbi:TauD/TfdA family dioxygenase, partial [Escherichia sp. TWPC-MK]